MDNFFKPDIRGIPLQRERETPPPPPPQKKIKNLRTGCIFHYLACPFLYYSVIPNQTPLLPGPVERFLPHVSKIQLGLYQKTSTQMQKCAT